MCKIAVVDPEGHDTKNSCAAEDQQQYTGTGPVFAAILLKCLYGIEIRTKLINTLMTG
jgi:hypothetical protein